VQGIEEACPMAMALEPGGAKADLHRAICLLLLERSLLLSNINLPIEIAFLY
jgi:hypothetical protein